MGRFVAWFGGLVILCAGVAGAAEAGVAVTNLPAGAGSTALPVEARLPPKYPGIWQKPVNYREPPREYETVSTNGWTIEVEKQLMSEDPELAGKAVARLSLKLNEALAALPEASRANLRKLKVFLMYGPKAKGGGRDNGTEYYQKDAPDCYQTLDPRWGNSLVIYSAENYVWQSDLWALKLSLHELAHAHHLVQWPEDRVEIVQAYEHAMSRKLYRNVRDDQGKTHAKAYAIQNPIEYFAELSCMYFAGCDYPPRNRKELKAYDPEGYAMIQKLWGIVAEAPSDDWKKSPVSMLASQIGYHPLNTKHVYLRSTEEKPPAGIFEKEFSVIDAQAEQEVFRGKVATWGRKWDTSWWVLDFTPLRRQGEFYVKTGKLVSSRFKIENGIFHKTDLTVIALDQLEHRIHQGQDDQRRGLQGLYTNCPPETRIYMDCGSPYAELEPVGTCVYALFELHDLLGREFSEKDNKRMIDLAALGADYFVAAQRSSSDPEIDGMFYHSLLVNNRDTWAGSFSTYLDAAYGMALMAKAHQFFKDRDPQRAACYLEAAKKAWKLCAHRPYHTKADRTFPYGCQAYFWNAPVGIQDTFGRAFYNILNKNWKMPDTLRTRDRLPFIQGSALLYEITGENKYLDKAIEFADVVVERQFTDWEHPIEGCFGTFYEFEGNNEAFFHEFMQGGFWWEGNVEAMNLEGFMHLLRLAPRNSKAALWQNAVFTYAENYARKSTTLNPLGIYPVACYRDPQHGGLKYFQNTLMGSACLYGFSAKNFMLLGDFLKDSSFQSPALAGVNFIGGLNPGIPNAYEETAWDARTLILGVGRSWFGPAGDLAETARGSVPNGFCAAPQFWQPTFDNFISYQSDKPRGMINKGGGLQFNEGWILHSHAYVQAVARLEAGYTLQLKTLNEGRAVGTGVSVVLSETEAPHGKITRTYRTDGDGSLVVTDLPTPCRGTVCITYNGREIMRPVAAVAGGQHAMTVDFAQEVNLDILLPGKMTVGSKGAAKIMVENTGSKEVKLKLLLSASGLQLSRTQLELTVRAGKRQKIAVPFECGQKVMPCLVRAIIDEGAPVRDFFGTGRICSK